MYQELINEEHTLAIQNHILVVVTLGGKSIHYLVTKAINHQKVELVELFLEGKLITSWVPREEVSPSFDADLIEVLQELKIAFNKDGNLTTVLRLTRTFSEKVELPPGAQWILGVL